MAVHKIEENVFVISSQQVWRPGAYDSERTAKYAFSFDDADLQKLQDSKNVGGVITFEDLQKLKKEQ